MVSPPWPRSQAQRRGLRLWPVGVVLALTFCTALVVAATVFYTGWDLLGARGLKTERRIDSKTLFDLVKLSFGVVAGAGALVALVVAYRRQRVDEDGALRDATRLHTERFTAAVTQLGDQTAAVRLGGVHALAGLADDAPTRDLRQTCIDVLCAYLRLPYTAEADLPAGENEALHTYLALREVRHTVIRVIRDHLRLPLDHPHSWVGHDFDFTGVVFDGGDFSEAVFSGTTTFSKARFSCGTVSFREANFSEGQAYFHETEFAGGTVVFTDSKISGGTVSFMHARFSGSDVRFRRTEFAAGWVHFQRAEFSGGTVVFNGARFSGSHVAALHATFSGSEVDFDGARISAGAISFDKSQVVDGKVSFDNTVFTGGTVSFSKVHFLPDGRTSFGGAHFAGGEVKFVTARFVGGRVEFPAAQFSSGTIDFDGARFLGSTVDFSSASGAAPSSLIPANGSPLPSGLVLPAAWNPTGP
jgi:uncharacterized protein YjbI with pentapeptide repeats